MVSFSPTGDLERLGRNSPHPTIREFGGSRDTTLGQRRHGTCEVTATGARRAWIFQSSEVLLPLMVAVAFGLPSRSPGCMSGSFARIRGPGVRRHFSVVSAC